MVTVAVIMSDFPICRLGTEIWSRIFPPLCAAVPGMVSSSKSDWSRCSRRIPTSSFVQQWHCWPVTFLNTPSPRLVIWSDYGPESKGVSISKSLVVIVKRQYTAWRWSHSATDMVITHPLVFTGFITFLLRPSNCNCMKERQNQVDSFTVHITMHSLTFDQRLRIRLLSPWHN